MSRKKEGRIIRKQLSKQEFRRLMYCGHGRCFAAMEQGNPAHYREIILHGCLHDLAFDMQCEGSRGIYMYHLTQYFDDADAFADAAAEKFQKLPPDADSWLIQHFCDFLTEFAADGTMTAHTALEEKYSQIYAVLSRTRRSAKRQRLLENYTYLCIILTQRCGMERFLKIAEDIGHCFRKDTEGANADLVWFLHCAKEEFGEAQMLARLQESSEMSPEIRRFLEILTYEQSEKHAAVRRTPPSAEEVLQLAKSRSLTHAHRRRFALAENCEKRKLAEYAASESEPEIRTKLWWMFDTSRNPFPLSPDILLRDAASEREELWQSALNALCHLQGDSIHGFAKTLLQKQPLHPAGIQMLLANYQPEDREQFLKILKCLKIDRNEQSGWHGVVMAILDHADTLPDESLLFIYERSLCSCCRESALETMKKRHMITPEITWECAHDSNSDIRKAYGSIE